MLKDILYFQFTVMVLYDVCFLINGRYRDFRDILCSHARRGGSGGVKACLDCDASSLESSKSVVTMLGKLFSNGGQAAELMKLEQRGALLLR